MEEGGIVHKGTLTTVNPSTEITPQHAERLAYGALMSTELPLEN
jgi:hypothetical protein